MPKPTLKIMAPAEGAEVFGSIAVDAVPDLERADQIVRFERSVGSAPWQTVKVDDSSPAFVYYDNVDSVALGTQIRYRATLTEPDGTRVRSAVRTVVRANPKPLVSSVTVAGSLQSELGCPEDWNPACATSHLEFDVSDGLWKKTFPLAAGTYEWKVAIDDSWTLNYGAGGAAGGTNLALEVLPGTTSVTFIWDQVSKVPQAVLNS